MPHNSPYRVTLLNRGQCVFINEKVLVNLSIGRYKDKGLCDVLQMDVYQLILGRPYQFDKQSMHNGAKNAYSLKKYGVNLKNGKKSPE